MFNYKRHLSYLKYVMKHKYYVFIAGRECDVKCCRLLTHDMSKFSPSEWMSYASTFYKENGDKQFKPDSAFDLGWLKHQHRNKHHWQYWLLRKDSGLYVPLKMPREYVREMVADWMGAGKAISGKWEVAEWYEKNRGNMVLHPKTQDEVDSIISIVKHFKG